MIKATVWNEFSFSCKCPEALSVYPKGHHETIKDFLNKDKNIKATAVTMDMPEQGLPDELLDNTDVLLWWGHCRHDDVSDALADKIVRRVYAGMGLILLHSAHLSKPFKRVLGASGRLNWGEGGERERLWAVNPAHPIVKGLPEYIDLENEEMYGEPFGIPEPDETVFISWFKGGRVMRSGVTYNRGAGKVFYFQPGHETFPTYHNPLIAQTIINAVHWAYADGRTQKVDCDCVLPLEKLDD